MRTFFWIVGFFAFIIGLLEVYERDPIAATILLVPFMLFMYCFSKAT